MSMAKYFFKIKENKNANEAFKIEVNQNIQIDNNRKVDKVNCDEEYLFDFDKCYGQGLLEANKRKKYIEDKLNAYQFPEKSNDVDLSNVMSDWFPVEKWDIFLSHRSDRVYSPYLCHKVGQALLLYLREHRGDLSHTWNTATDRRKDSPIPRAVSYRCPHEDFLF